MKEIQTFIKEVTLQITYILWKKGLSYWREIWSWTACFLDSMKRITKEVSYLLMKQRLWSKKGWFLALMECFLEMHKSVWVKEKEKILKLERMNPESNLVTESIQLVQLVELKYIAWRDKFSKVSSILMIFCQHETFHWSYQSKIFSESVRTMPKWWFDIVRCLVYLKPYQQDKCH